MIDTSPRLDRGFALIAVLWLIAVLGTLVGLSMATTRLGNQTTTNRIVLTRGRWAAEACLAIIQARWVQRKFGDTASIDLGRGTRCQWAVEDPTARINFNTVDNEVLHALGASDAFNEALADRRREAPFDDLGQLAELPGWDTSWASLGTVTGPGSMNLSAASRSVLSALPGLSPEAVDRILYRRSVGRAFTSLDALAADLSPPARAALLARYADLARIATFTAPQLVVTAQGWVQGQAPEASIESLVVPLPDRLAVVRRRMW
jgi:DNA uptake protein ComE-like DNA-binding protein